MEKKEEVSPENSSSKQGRRPERPRPLPSTGGSGSGSGSGNGSGSSFLNALGVQGNRPATRPTAEIMRTSLPVATTPPPARVMPVAARAGNSGKGVMVEAASGKNAGNFVRWPQEWTGKKRDYSEDKTASSSGKGSKLKRKVEAKEQPKRQPCCTTCGKIFATWKALFGHLRSHPDRDYRGAFPPPKNSDGEFPEESSRCRMIPGMDPRKQEAIASCLFNAAAVVASRLAAGGGRQENAKKIGETSGSSASFSISPRPPLSSSRVSSLGQSNPEGNRRSLRKDGLNLDLNLPAPELDSDEEDQE